ncbi:50S ribosomal protein L29 [Patescibacteria group bacterium]
MKIKEIRKKRKIELDKDLSKMQEKLRELRFKAALKQLKNHREIPLIKRDIARILTVIGEQELLKEVKVDKKLKTNVTSETPSKGLPRGKTGGSASVGKSSDKKSK